jgi:hypothetical protein
MSHPFLLLLIIPFIISCRDVQNPSAEKLNHAEKPFSDTTKNKSKFNEPLCRIEGFKIIFDCNNSAEHIYQVELSNHFKDDFYITIILKDSEIENIYLTRFRLSLGYSRAYAKKFNNKFNVFLPSNRDSIYCYYDESKKINIKDNITINKLNRFFIEQIWDLPKNENSVIGLDPEMWRVKGKRRGEQSFWERHTFSDSIYYKNIQLLLTECKIKEYAYKRK